MTDSDSDLGVVDVRNRLLELVYSSNAVLTVDQIARILGAKESRILEQLKRYHNEIVYDQANGTVVIRRQTQEGQREANLTARIRNFPSTSPVNYGSDGYEHFRARGGQAKGTLRKAKYRRTLVREIGTAAPSESDAPKGHVGYVCVADEFRLSALETHYSAQGYYTKFDFDVLHIRFSDKEMSSKDAHGIPNLAAHGGRGVDSNTVTNKNTSGASNTGGEKPGEHAGSRMSAYGVNQLRKAGFDLFVFEYGAIVWWGFDQRFFRIVENDFMLPNSPISRHMVNRYMTQLVNENYPVWCDYTLVNKEALEPDEHFKEQLRFDHFLIPFGRGDYDTSNVCMLCVSHALAQSAKIDYLEIKVQELTESCSPLPRELREEGHANITERRLLQLRGEVLSYRLMLKSGSNLMDEPDFFWENAHLKPVFQATKECFEIVERAEGLDNKLGAANEILSMLAEEFSQRHGVRLEWIVIWLVFVEVVIGVLELLVDVKPWMYPTVKNGVI